MATLDSTREWLRGVLQPYQNPDRVYRDADAVLQSYNGLTPKTDTYTYETGQTLVLLCLHGTIPIKFRNVTYNIPIATWVPTSYPHQPPIVFVTPTSSMVVRASRHVDLSGKVYHPYLAYWHTRWEDSTLSHFMTILQEIFTAEPPVYTKPATSSTSTSPTGPSQNQYPSNPNFTQPPSYTPLPAYSASTPTQHPTSQPPPIPPNPLHSNRMSLQPHQQQQQQQQRPISPSQQQQQRQQHPPSPPPPPVPAKPGVPTSSTPTFGIGSPSHHPTTPQPPPPLDPKLARLNTLKSALAQKLREREQHTKLQLTAEIERLLVVNRELVEGEGRLSSLLAKLAEEQQRIQTNSAILEEKNGEIEKVVEELRGRGDVNPDDVVLGRGVGGVQLFELVADEYAIDDAVYCLSNALSREAIGLQVFMKHVRTLARDQFMRRALIKKIRAQGGLGVAG